MDTLMSKLSLGDRKIVVAIDFGTTYSGVAWAKVLDGHINIVDQWPAENSPLTGASSEKVPTDILYDEGEPQGFIWGYQIPSDVERHQWFKLGLDATYNPTTELSKRYPHPNNLPANLHHNAQQLTADYLKALKDHLKYILQIQLGELQVKDTPLQFILTVPAVWSEIAKEKTLQAAETAGMGLNAPILMISEPEAAATYALHRQDLRDLIPGDTFVVCDAGGGTVDLISYTVVKLEPTLKVKEAVAGTGGLCGSTYLNRRFGEFLQSRLGEEQGWDDEILFGAMKTFDREIKKAFSSTSKNKTYTVPVVGLANNPALGIKRGKLYLSSEDIKEILKPVIDEVVKLVLGQIQATASDVKAVLLVGGFGSSMYLRERLREAVKSSIEVLQPPYGWTAVVRGALLKGLADSDPKHSTVRLTSRVARKHIGMLTNTIFDEEIHSEDKKFFSDFSGEWKTRAMSWFINKGDTVKEHKPYKFSYKKFRAVELGRPDQYTTIIYRDCTDRSAVVYKDEKVLELVKLTVNAKELAENSIDMEMGDDDELYYVFRYCVEVTYFSASTKYELVCKGKRYSAVTAEYV